MSLNNYS